MESKIVQLKAGDKLCNGVIVTEQLARAYNSLTEQIEGFKAEGRTIPEHLLNGRHNLIKG